MDILYSLDKDSSEYLYLQLYHTLVGAIRRQEYAPGQKMPSLTELSKATGISRMTVRQALQRLIHEGWLYTVPGKGTFVSRSPNLTQNLQVLRGWTEEVSAQGYAASSKLVAADIISADSNVAGHLQIKPGAQVYSIKRLRYADSFVMGVETAYLESTRYPGLIEQFHSSGSLYQLLRERYNVRLLRAEQVVDAIAANHTVASLLEINPGAPVLMMERTTYTYYDEPVEFVVSIYKAGFVHFKTELVEGVQSSSRVVLPPRA